MIYFAIDRHLFDIAEAKMWFYLEAPMRKVMIWMMAACLCLGACVGTQKPTVEGDAVIQREESGKSEKELKQFVEEWTAKVAPLEKALNLAFWAATNFGKREDYDRASELEIQIRRLYSDKQTYEIIKRNLQATQIQDSLLLRQLILLKDAFEENQVEPALMEQMVRLSNEAEKAFNDYRGIIEGKQVTDNELLVILKAEHDSGKRQQAWETYMARGNEVRDKLIALVKLRNLTARRLGYPDFYQMRLALIEQQPQEIQSMFDELARLTDAPFTAIMQEVQGELAKHYSVAQEDLRPWHYDDPFFQEAPTVRGVRLDRLFEKVDAKDLVRRFYVGIGIDPQDILDRSDLYERPGKKPNAYCMDVDRQGDVRILANLRNSEKWTSTLLHEMGHAVYDKYIDPQLPYLLRRSSHTFTTEAIAELFGRLTRNPTWLEKTFNLPSGQLEPIQADIDFGLRLRMLVFARWSLVMVNFERALYQNPDQDLNKLWWELKKRYQLLSPPEGRDAPDWAAKIHLTSAPVYYHNYMLGEMMASQLLNYLGQHLLPNDDPKHIDFIGHPELGAYLKQKIFAPGASLRWDQLLIQATGETLNPKYFVEQFVRGTDVRL
jgi:peptidyl-dipeptidase A